MIASLRILSLTAPAPSEHCQKSLRVYWTRPTLRWTFDAFNGMEHDDCDVYLLICLPTYARVAAVVGDLGRVGLSIRTAHYLPADDY